MTIKRKRKNEENSIRLIVFNKNPILGKAKTRLAKSVGTHQALDIYFELLRITQNLVESTGISTCIYYSDFIDPVDQWIEVIDKKCQMPSADLGERIYHALETELKSASKVMVIGADCPYILPDHLEAAMAALESEDVVLGPSHDGGFYLLGVHAVVPALFDRIEWSTSGVADQLRKNTASAWDGRWQNWKHSMTSMKLKIGGSIWHPKHKWGFRLFLSRKLFKRQDRSELRLRETMRLLWRYFRYPSPVKKPLSSLNLFQPFKIRLSLIHPFQFCGFEA